MSAAELVALVCCDLGAIVRGRSVPATELGEHLRTGVGWVPANHALTPLGPVAEANPFGSTGDLRLLPDASTRARVAAADGEGPLELVLCDIVETDGLSAQASASFTEALERPAQVNDRLAKALRRKRKFSWLD